MKEYDALEAAYKNGFKAGYHSRDTACVTWEAHAKTLTNGQTLHVYRCPMCGSYVCAKTPYCPYCGTKINLEE